MPNPFTYDEVQQSFEAVGRPAGFATMPDYVRYLSEGGPETAAQFAAGAEESKLKDFNSWINSVVNATGLPEAGEVLGAEVAGGLFNAPEAGGRAGAAAARGLVNLAPLLLTGGGTLPVQLAGQVGTGALSGLDVYGATGDATSAGATAVLSAFIPQFAKAGSAAGLAAVGAPKVAGIATDATSAFLGRGVAAGATVNTRVAETLGQRVASYLGGQTGALIPFGAKDYVEAKARGVENPLATKDYWVETVIGQLPFAASDVKSITTKGPSAKAIQSTLTDKVPTAPPSTKTFTPPAAVIQTVDPKTEAQTNIVLNTMKKKAQVEASGLEGLPKKTALEAIDAEQNKALAALNTDAPAERKKTQLGVLLQDDPNVTLRGTIRGESQPNPNIEGHEGSIFLYVEGADTTGFAGKVVGIPKKLLVANADGSFTVPKKYAFMAKNSIAQRPTERTLPLGEVADPLVGPVEGVPKAPEPALDAFGNPDWSVDDPDGGVALALREFGKDAPEPKAVGLTPEAKTMLDSIDKGGAAPAFISKNLEKLAKDNGVEITGSMTPADVVTALRAKKDAVSEAAPVGVEGDLTPEQIRIAKTKAITEALARKQAADEAKIAAATKVQEMVPKEIPQTLEAAKAQLSVVDKANAAVENGKLPVTDADLKREVEAELAKGKGKEDLTTVTQKVVTKVKARAEESAETVVKQTKRKQKQLERQVKGAVTFGEVKEAAKAVNAALTAHADAVTDAKTQGKPVPEAPVIDPALQRDADEVALLDDIMEQYEGSTEGRMMQFGDELKVAYANWRNDGALQNEIFERAKGDPEKITTLRKASLLTLAKTVRLSHISGKVITGGKILRPDGTWTAKKEGEKQARKTFASKDEAEAYFDDLIENDATGDIDAKNVKAVPSPDRKGNNVWYLIERPREMSVEFVPGEVISDKPALTQAEMAADVNSDAFQELVAERESDVALKAHETLEALRKTGNENVAVIDTIREITLNLTQDDAKQAYIESGEEFLPSDIEHAALRIAVLNDGQAGADKEHKGTLPDGKWKEENYAEFQARVLSKNPDAGFDSVNEIKDFLNSQAVRLLRMEVGRRLREGLDHGIVPAWVGLGGKPIDPKFVDDMTGTLVKEYNLDAPSPVAALERMAKAGNELALGLLEYKDILKDVKLKVSFDWNGGQYRNNTNEIRMGAGFIWHGAKAVDHVLIHEAAHAVSSKLMRQFPNHPAVRQLDKLRAEYTKALPEHLQKAVEKAIANNLYDRFSRGEKVRWGVPESDVPLLYAALNVDEFVANSFSDQVVRDILGSVKSTGKKTLMQWWAHWIGKLVGKTNTQGTLLEDTLLAANRVFTVQKSFMHYENLSKRLLTDMGLPQFEMPARLTSIWQIITSPTQSALGYMQQLNAAFNADIDPIVARVIGMEALTPTELYAYQQGKDELRNLPPEQLAQFKEFLNEFDSNHDQGDLVSDVTNVIQRVVHDPKQLQELLEFSPDGVSYIASAINQHARNTLEVLIAQEKAADAGLSNLRPLGNLTTLQEAMAMHEKLADIITKVSEDRNQVAAFDSQMKPEGFLELGRSFDNDIRPSHAVFPRPVADAIDLPETQKTIGAFAKAVGPAWQVAMEHPAMKPVVTLAFDFKGEVGRALHRVFSHFATKVSPDGVVDWNKDTMKRAEGFFSRPDLLQRADKILLLRNAKKGFLSAKDPQDARGLNDALAGLSPKDRDLVLEMADHQSRSMQELQEVIVEGEKDMGTVALANVLHHGTTNDVEASRKLAQQMLGAVQRLRDPAQMQMAMSEIEALRAQMDPQKFLNAIQFAQAEVQRVGEFEAFFAERQWFATEQRFDKWKVRARLTDGRAFFVDGPTREAALNKLKQTDGSASVLDIIAPEKDGDPSRLYGIPEKFLQRLSELEEQQTRSMQSAGATPEMLEAREAQSLVGILKKEIAAHQLYKPGSKRLGVAGREYLPMMANHFNYGTAVVNSLLKRKTRAEALFRVQNPDLVAAPDQAKLALEHVENFLAPDSEWARKAGTGVAVYNLGFNLANHMAEATQSMLTHTTQLTAEGAGIVGSYKRVLGSAKDIFNWAKSGGKWKNPEHEKAMQQWTLDKEIGFGVWDDSLADSDEVLSSFRNLIKGEEPQGVKSVVKGAVQGYAKLGANLYGVFTHFNARVALLSSFDFYRSKGMDFETAYEKAREFNRTVNFSGGRAARPVGLYKTRGEWRSASQMLGLMRSYTLGMWSTLARNIKGGFSKNSTLSYADRINSRKATVQMLATMFALGGAMGLPGVEAAVAAVEQLTDLKLKESMREFTAKFTQDPAMTEGFLMGVPNMMGVDAHSRLSLGGFPGVSAFDGFSLTDLLGPAYGLGERFAVGSKKVLGGKPTDGFVYALPPGFRRGASLVGNEGNISGPRGELIASPTFGEKVVLAVGFDPTRIASLKESNRIHRRSQLIDKEETNSFNMQVASNIASGDIASAKASVQKRAMTHKDQDLKSIVRGIQDAVERKTFPAELLDKPGNATALAKTYGMKNIPNEVARLQLRDHVAKLLGVQSTLTPRSLNQASLVDAILSRSPELSRQQARRVLAD